MSTQIKTLSPNGSFENNGKTLYSFSITTYDNQSGNIVDVKPTARYKVGDWVEVSVMGAYKGVNKLQLTKVGPPAHNEQRQEQRPVSQARVEQRAREDAAFPEKAAPVAIKGETVGMALKEAVGICLHQRAKVDVDDPMFWEEVERAAGNIIRIGKRLMNGEHP